MTRPRHISLRHRNVLSGRLLGMPELRRKASALPASPFKEALAALRSELKIWTRAALNTSNFVPLDSFLQSIPIQLRSVATGWALRDASIQSVLDKTVSDVQRQMGSVCCAQCAGPGSPICQGENVDADSVIVEKGGQCILPLKETFHVAAEIARAYYRRFAKKQFQNVPAKILFHTKEEGGKPHQFDLSLVPFQVSGVTEFEVTATKWVTIVSLVLWVEEFDWDTYLACPYVFLHELICHAFKRPFPQSARESKQPDIFAEGWMDWVALLILEKEYPNLASWWQSVAKAQKNSTKKPAFPLRDRGQVKVARMYHEGRLNCDHENAPPVCVDWQRGKEAAEKLRDLMQVLVDDYVEAFFEFSLRFNLLPLPWEDVEKFIRILIDNLPYAGEEPQDRAKFQRIFESVRKYLKKRNLSAIKKLITEVLGLWGVP
jgi:hypothetical protein